MKALLRLSSIVVLLGVVAALPRMDTRAAEFEFNQSPVTVRVPDGGLPTSAVPHLELPHGGPSLTLANLVIQINFGGGLSESQEALFTTAKTTWQNLLYDYLPPVLAAGPRPSPAIDASGVTMDGEGGILGRAGPTYGVTQGGYTLVTAGFMEFDTADLPNMEASGLLDEVIMHEMAHVLGLGTVWTYNNVYVTGSGQYTGANGLYAWKSEFNRPSDLYVPVELGGGSGTANGHWNEVDGGGSDTGITQVGTGYDLRYELMTGWLNAPTFLSQTTVSSYRDIGFNSVPEPADYALVFGLVSLAAGFSVRRRPRRP